MKQLIYAVIGSALLGLSLTAAADDSVMMKAMDTNGDGKISKEEYMAYHEKMWMSMKKDSGGMVDGKSMMMLMHHGMTGDKHMTSDKMSR